MSQVSDHSGTAGPLRPGDAALGPHSATLRSLRAGNPKRSLFQLDLLRSLQLHRGMALSFALAGLVLGAAYFLLLTRSEPLAQSLTSLSAPATAALHVVMTSALRNAALIVLAGVLFGVLAAVISHKMDPVVYIADDVGQVLGIATLAQIPELSEVSSEVEEEYVLRLSLAIEHACKQGRLRSCIFTGTGPGVGVTTLVTRVREILEAMGRTTVLVDAAEIWDSAGPGLAGTERGSWASALVRQMIEGTENQEDSLVLVDTSPLAVAAETEFLARFADCVIVVAESGVTTRLQLRQVATVLQGIDVAVVGFVLNRVGLKKADSAFRHSVRDIEDYLDRQSNSGAGVTVRNRPAGMKDEPAANQVSEKTVKSDDAGPETQENHKAAAAAPNRLSLSVVPEQLLVPTEPSPVPPRTSRLPLLPEPTSSETEAVAQHAPEITSSETELIQPVLESVSDEPWWLADPHLRPGGGPHPETLPELLTALEQKIEVITEAAKVSDAQTAIPTELAEVSESESIAAAAPEILPVESTASSGPRLAQEPGSAEPWTAPAQSWERVTHLYETIKTIDASEKATEQPQKATEEAQVAERKHESEPEETLFQPASRFDGLRNLATMLGLKKLREQAGSTQLSGQSEFDQERARSLYQRASSRASEPATTNLTGTASAVIERPEVVSSQAAAETTDTGSAEKSASSTPAQDEVEILRSRRGQYKTQ